MNVNTYSYRRRWKWLLFAIGIVIVAVSMWYSNKLVERIAEEERSKVKLWADAIQRKANLVNYTEQLFEKLKLQERKRVEIWAEANRKLITADPSEDLTFYLKIISDNTTIPVIVTDDRGKITTAINLDPELKQYTHMTPELKAEFSGYNPMVIRYYGNLNIHLYYKDSKVISELKTVMDDLIRSFISEVVYNSASSPVIITDSTKTNVLAYGNMPDLDTSKIQDVRDVIREMRFENTPIVIELSNQGFSYIYYKDSYLLTAVRYYPIIQLTILGFFLFLAYFLFSTSRNAEQNLVWMGMAKETAHQLGTPISSLMAWMEVIRMKYDDQEITAELDKDIVRLNTIADRFSKIGSPSQLVPANIAVVLERTLNYLKPRISKNVNFTLHQHYNGIREVNMNEVLFEWVVENICRNAVDSMAGKGNITIDILEEGNSILVDITDTGKGIPKSRWRSIFRPGFSTKQKGWGLGLSLAERIIKRMHAGKIFVKKSTDKGTTFRIILKMA